MFSFIEYYPEYRNQWNEFVREHGNIFHGIEWKEILEESFGYKTHYMMVLDEEAVIVGALPLVIGRDLKRKRGAVSLPFVNYLDICCKDMASFTFMTDQLYPALNTLKLDYAELRFMNSNLEEHQLERNENNYTLILPLEGDEEKVMELSTSSNRNHTRKTYKNEWFKVNLEWDKLDGFYGVYSRTMKRLGSPCPSIKFFHNIRDKMGDKVKLLTVLDRSTDAVIGGMVLFIWKDVVYYYWGGALEEYNKKYVNNFMYWEAVKFSIARGCKALDLGRSPKDSGTYKFKVQFGAVPHPLKYLRICKDIKKVKAIQKEDMKLAIGLWKILPKVLTDEIGKKIIKHIMP